MTAFMAEAQLKEKLYRPTLRNIIRNGAGMLKQRITTPALSELQDESYDIPLEIDGVVRMTLHLTADERRKVAHRRVQLRSQGMYHFWYISESGNKLITKSEFGKLESAADRLADFLDQLS